MEVLALFFYVQLQTIYESFVHRNMPLKRRTKRAASREINLL